MTSNFFSTCLETQNRPNYWYARWSFGWCSLRQRNWRLNSGLKSATIVTNPLLPGGGLQFSEFACYIFQPLGECHCWWTKETPRAHVAVLSRSAAAVLIPINIFVYQILKEYSDRIPLPPGAGWLHGGVFSRIMHEISWNIKNIMLWLEMIKKGGVQKYKIGQFIIQDFYWTIWNKFKGM